MIISLFHRKVSYNFDIWMVLGGCGACVVVLTRLDPVLKQRESFSVSSCLTLLCSLNGFSVTTSEGLGNSKDGFHPIHQRFAGFHASQCGFCTPGMCMSFFSALANAEKTEAPDGFSSLTVSEAEKSITGNLCRCTGYRPIVDACKSCAADVDLKDLGLNSFWKRGDSKEVKASKLPPFNPKDNVCPYVQVMKGECKILNSEKLSWFTPVSLQELSSLLNSNMVGNGGLIKLVVGNTGMGYYKETEKFDKYIDLRYIPELSMVMKDDNLGIEFGAALPISKVILHLKEESKSNLLTKKISEHMERVASNFIRNSASIGGNLVMAQRKYFPSDIATLLLAVGSTVCILKGSEQERTTIEEFLYGPPLGLKDVLLSVYIPFLEPSRVDDSATSDSRLIFESYRAAPRPLGNALPYLNAAFLADVTVSSNKSVVNYARLVFGAYGTKHATRAREVEEYLAGKTLNLTVLDESVRLVKCAVVPEEGTSHPAYRTSLAVSFLFSFLTTFVDSSLICGGSSLEVAVKCNEEIHTSPLTDKSLLSSAKQLVGSSRDYYPVGEPIPKTGAAIQASGLFCSFHMYTFEPKMMPVSICHCCCLYEYSFR